MKTIKELKDWIRQGISLYNPNNDNESIIRAEYEGMLEGVLRCEEIIKPRNVNEIKPPALVNVLVLYPQLDQDFWTRGYLINDQWHVMMWDERVVVAFNQITYWLPLPNNI